MWNSAGSWVAEMRQQLEECMGLCRCHFAAAVAAQLLSVALLTSNIALLLANRQPGALIVQHAVAMIMPSLNNSNHCKVWDQHDKRQQHRLVNNIGISMLPATPTAILQDTKAAMMLLVLVLVLMLMLQPAAHPPISNKARPAPSYSVTLQPCTCSCGYRCCPRVPGVANTVL
ncbi:hypothetical protein COO60DRAFT_1478890 [Scenedesmus sp. NREL 46B-D3]|nr:hypothetical protein COO60DRAFT_1478890 [Scenedesmus sp. NREL 46B-D3]